VLSPYGAQVSELHRALAPIRRAKNLNFKQSIQNSNRDQDHVGACAHTVDSFQGNEADLVVVSLVRNNTSTVGAGLGFLKGDSARFNVMLSRAQKLLVLVGSWEFFQQQVSLVDLENKTDELWSVRVAIDQIAKYFADGTAVRIPASEILALESTQ
jgi:superfamily I DNA and/or RNA helicase